MTSCQTPTYCPFGAVCVCPQLCASGNASRCLEKSVWICRVGEQQKAGPGSLGLTSLRRPTRTFGKLAFHPSFYSSSDPMFANSVSWDEKSVWISRVSEQQKTGSSLPGLTSLRRSTRTFGTSCQTPTNGQRKWPFANSDELTSDARQLAYAWTFTST